MLVINPVCPLWEMDLGKFVFASASHSSIFEIINDINTVRLGKDHDYYNTGIVLMDLAKARKTVKTEDIFDCVRKRMDMLFLPDQDVFNLLYGAFTMQLDDNIWNYDARYLSEYQLRSEGKCNMGWVMQNIVLLHFYGKRKLWKSKSSNRFSALYESCANRMNGKGPYQNKKVKFANINT